MIGARPFAAAGRAPNRSYRQLSPRVVAHDVGWKPDAPGPEGMLYLAQCNSAEHAFVFGDGSHPTTRLCAGAVDLLCRERPGMAVLDVGTGTGILARIARARGASLVVGTDIDSAAIEMARVNAAMDEAAPLIHFGGEPPDHWGARFDLVVANILAEPLIELAPALAAAMKPNGGLIVSGFTRAQVPALRCAFEAQRLPLVREAQLAEWTLLVSQGFA